MKSQHPVSLLGPEGRSPWMAGRLGLAGSRRASSVRTKIAAALVGAVTALVGVSPAEAQCTQCSASSDKSSCTASGTYDYCCLPGWILADNTSSNTATVSMTLGANSLKLLQTINNSSCCVAPYANIGIFDGCQSSDQWMEAGSHLPIQLKDIAVLKGAWTFQVPLPLKASEQYRVYYEMFLSSTSAGHADSGNLTSVMFWSNFAFNATTGHANINGSQGMDLIDYGVNGTQGPFVDFLFPKGTYSPDANGVVTVPSVDVKAILDYALTTFPNYYKDTLYLSSLSLAVEAGTFKGTVTTSYASFEVQKTGSPTVVTPSFTANHWNNCMTAADCDDGDACTTDSCVASVCSNVAVPGCADSGASSTDDGGGSSGSSGSSGSGGASGGGGTSGGSSSAGGTTGGGLIGSSAAGLGGGGDGGASGRANATNPGSSSSGGCNTTAAAGQRDGVFAVLWLLGLAAITQRRSRGKSGGSSP